MMPKDNLIIKILSEQDTNLLRECAELSGICIPDGWHYESFLSEIRKENGLVIAGSDNQHQLAGFLTASYVCDTADLTNIAVAPAFRQQGIAFQLLDFLLRKLEASGVRTVFLEVRRSNQPAIRLYEKSGFVPVGVRKNFYQHPVEDAILMQYQK